VAREKEEENVIVQLELPQGVSDLGLTQEGLTAEVQKWLTISLFRQRKVSARRAGELLGLSQEQFLDLLDEEGILYTWKASGGVGETPSAWSMPVVKDKSLALAALNEELVRANQRLREAVEKVREADRLKTEFLATMSHELRTPLNSIIGFSKVLLNGLAGPLTDMQRVDLTAIYTSGQHLLGLVNDILDLSKIEAGKMTLNKEWLDFHEIVAGVMSTAVALVEDKPIQLREKMHPNLPRVYADRMRVRQVILNLVSNAAKFTDEGSITLEVRPVVEDGRRWVLCSVQDTGIGIAPDNLPDIFEAFRQLDSTTARRAEGTGLGLSISRRLAEMHGGRLYAESTPGEGSTFYFALPVHEEGRKMEVSASR
jgi:signal transduction histidine kinase